MKLYMFLLLASTGFCLAEIELPNHPTNLDEVPALKEKCLKSGKPDTYDRLKLAINETRSCLEGKINPSKIKEELEVAKKTGSMDEVFGKYCKKREEYKECVFKTVNVSKECLEENEINALNKATSIVEEIVAFTCFRDGDRLAMFVAEGGSECVSSRSEQIKNCITNTFKIDSNSLSFSSFPTALPTLRIDKEKCDKFEVLQECVVNDLETNCKDTTPANIIDALFKFIKKSTCKNI
ncbi:27 kDa glycoprotein-like [Euwallacea fornicatus]|uniref:27 kDa glycoprotein-like n=1 Tax=Euwallacea fornicatus TaxID=995702 RepID=UPI00338E0C11